MALLTLQQSAKAVAAKAIGLFRSGPARTAYQLPLRLVRPLGIVEVSLPIGQQEINDIRLVLESCHDLDQIKVCFDWIRRLYTAGSLWDIEYTYLLGVLHAIEDRMASRFEPVIYRSFRRPVLGIRPLEARILFQEV